MLPDWLAGNLLLLAGRFSDAKTLAEKALSKNPQDVTARILLANATAGLKDIDTAIKEFEEASNWTRSEFIEKGGWDKMPGQDKASDGVARACAAGVELLVKK